MADEPVRRVVELLTASGYRPLPVPFSIGGSVDFDFAAIRDSQLSTVKSKVSAKAVAWRP